LEFGKSLVKMRNPQAFYPAVHTLNLVIHHLSNFDSISFLNSKALNLCIRCFELCQFGTQIAMWITTVWITIMKNLFYTS